MLVRGLHKKHTDTWSGRTTSERIGLKDSLDPTVIARNRYHDICAPVESEFIKLNWTLHLTLLGALSAVIPDSSQLGIYIFGSGCDNKT